MSDQHADYVAPCVCRHPAHLHTGPWYATGLGTVARSCDECPCAYYAPVLDGVANS
jgi:hypothetical protein